MNGTQHARRRATVSLVRSSIGAREVVWRNIKHTGIIEFLRATAGTAKRTMLTVCPSVCLSRPGIDSRPGEIETPGFHHIIA